MARSDERVVPMVDRPIARATKSAIEPDDDPAACTRTV